MDTRVPMICLFYLYITAKVLHFYFTPFQFLMNTVPLERASTLVPRPPRDTDLFVVRLLRIANFKKVISQVLLSYRHALKELQQTIKEQSTDGQYAFKIAPLRSTPYNTRGFTEEDLDVDEPWKRIVGKSLFTAWDFPCPAIARLLEASESTPVGSSSPTQPAI